MGPQLPGKVERWEQFRVGLVLPILPALLSHLTVCQSRRCRLGAGCSVTRLSRAELPGVGRKSGLTGLHSSSQEFHIFVCSSRFQDPEQGLARLVNPVALNWGEVPWKSHLSAGSVKWQEPFHEC